jgi:hypothetical protein
MAALRIALSEVATRDFVRSEIRNLLEELEDKDGRGVRGDADAHRRGDHAGAADPRP